MMLDVNEHPYINNINQQLIDMQCVALAYCQLVEFYKYILFPCDVPDDPINLIQDPGVDRQISDTRVTMCTYEHCLSILSNGMTIVDIDKTRILKEFLRIIVIDEAHMLWDDRRSKIVNQFIGLARLMNIHLLLMTGTINSLQCQILTMRLGHKFIFAHSRREWSLLPRCDDWELPDTQ
jgi:hypothetical protein